MSDDLIKRLREADSYNKKYYVLDPLHNEAADRIEELERDLAKAVEALREIAEAYGIKWHAGVLSRAALAELEGEE